MGKALALAGVAMLGVLTGCGQAPIKPAPTHIRADEPRIEGTIPPPVQLSPVVPPPKPTARPETYSVVVNNVRVQELLFALARDARLNVDIHNDITGTVTLNAIDQTLPQLLTRISRQVDLRWEIDGQNLVVMRDTPFLRVYRIDYVNLVRDTRAVSNVSTQVSGASQPGGSAASQNNSTAVINSVSANKFWDTLVGNIKEILQETDKVLPGGSAQPQAAAPSTAAPAQTAPGGVAVPVPVPAPAATFREAASVIANPETGILNIRATSRQHEKVQEFLDHVMTNAKRQVLIEATVAEVQLSNEYQRGIDWQRLRSNAASVGVPSFGQGSSGVEFGQVSSGTPANISTNAFIFGGAITSLNFNFALRLLESFGDVKVLSSPKISVMNNQTAMLRVVDNLVYFTIKADTTSTQTTSTTTFTTTAVTVPTGFTMSVTPQISDSDTVLLNLRPSITRLLGYVNDPNPALANPCGVGVTNCSTPAIVSRIPQLQTREMESVLKIENNQIAIMGGLMQDEINNLTDTIPLLGDVPVAGNLFKNRNDTKTKTELVIFLRPVVIKDASIDGDFGAYRSNLPDANFLKPENEKAKP
jgi:general secretion pathway protein D